MALLVDCVDRCRLNSQCLFAHSNTDGKCYLFPQGPTLSSSPSITDTLDRIIYQKNVPGNVNLRTSRFCIHNHVHQVLINSGHRECNKQVIKTINI